MNNSKTNNFLHDLALRIIADYSGDFSKLKVVLPSKRSVVFFRYFLGNSIEKSSWAPEIITISEWISELTTYEEMDKTTLLFELFQVVKDYLKKDDPIADFYHHFTNLKFDNFYPFGETLLSDFNEMDAYHIDHNDLFRILKEHAELESVFDYLSTEQIEAIQEFWRGFSKDNLSKEQKGFIELWKFLPGLYEQFRNHLIKKGKVYGGLNYKLAVDGIIENNIEFDTETEYIFAGFNALNSCEISLLSALQDEANVSFYWDADEMYIEKKEHEAGFFIRELINKFPDKADKHHFPNYINREGREPYIHLIGTSSIELQSKAMSDILSSNPKMQDTISTAIVLSDESFLFPVLYALPDSTQHLNVTMGYPISDSSLYSFVNMYFTMFKNLETESLKGLKTIDILKIFRNPFIEKCFDLRKTIKEIAKEKKKVLSPINLSKKLNNNSINDDSLKELFKPCKSGNDAINQLAEFFNSLLASENDITNILTDFEKEFFYYIYTYINELHALLTNAKEQINLKSAARIIQRGLQGLRVPFTGEPIAGMQIMGVLETRTLDFENLFIIGLNEGIWPKISTAPTLIPESIRRGFGLTTIQHQDSIYAYYFYRLLHRSENVYLLYNNVIGDGQGKEKSRFITQLKELHPELIASDTTRQLPLYNTIDHDITIERTPEIQAELMSYGKKRLSASAINDYLSCSLKFYFKKILKLSEPESDFEALGPREIGNLLHHAMEYIYEPYKTKIVKDDDIKKIKSNISKYIHEAFSNEYLNDRRREYQLDGEDKIIYHLVETYINKVLNHDLKRVPFTVIDTEVCVSREINIPISDGKEESIRIKGIIDRVDEKAGNYYLIDYKTGSDVDHAYSINKIFSKESSSKKKPKAILQMMLYSYLYMEQQPTKNITPLLYTIRSLKTDSIIIGKNEVSFTPNDENELMAEYLEELKPLINEILFSITPFSKTEDNNQCIYCPYTNICGR